MTLRAKKGDFGVIARQRGTMCMQLQRRRTVDTDDHCRTFPARDCSSGGSGGDNVSHITAVCLQ